MRAALAALVGAEHVHDPADWLEDITEHPAGKADLTVAPGTREEVVAVVRWAATEGVAVTPVVAGYNVAGIAIPQGGIVLDLRRLDGIEVDEDTHDGDRRAGRHLRAAQGPPRRAPPRPRLHVPVRAAVHLGADERAPRRPEQPLAAGWRDGALAHRRRGRAGRRHGGAHRHGRGRRPVVRPGAAARSHGSVRVDAGHHRRRAARRPRARAQGAPPQPLVRVLLVARGRQPGDAGAGPHRLGRRRGLHDVAVGQAALRRDPGSRAGRRRAAGLPVHRPHRGVGGGARRSPRPGPVDPGRRTGGPTLRGRRTSSS